MALNDTLRVAIEKPTLFEMTRPDATALPKLFGANWGDPAFRGSHGKRQVLSAELSGKRSDYTATYVRPVDDGTSFSETSRALQATMIASQSRSRLASLEASGSSSAFMSLDDKVLRFFAFFEETCRESAVERRRIRKVTIKFFAADDTILIEEKRIPNSGLPGGPILKRQRVPLSATDKLRRVADSASRFPDTSSVADKYTTIDDFMVGGELQLHGTKYYIYACDDFSRAFLSSLGAFVPDNEPEPDDKYMTEFRATRIDGRSDGVSFESRDLSITLESLASKGKSATRYPLETDRTRRFFQESGKVLRFSAFWVDREVTPAGRCRLFDLRCFVEDDTISIVEKFVPGPMADSIPKTFLSRRRIPVSGTASKAVELTFAGRINGQREAVLGAGDSYVDGRGLFIGGKLSVFGREFTLYDCDAFTRQYCSEVFGVEQSAAIDIQPLMQSAARRTAEVAVPPPTGYGTHEDSLASCKSLVLKPPRKDTSGWLEHAGEELRYQIKLINPDRPEDAERSFVLSFYLESGEIMITENALRNSGYTGGKFLRKQKIRKLPLPAEGPSAYYALGDLVVGNIMTANGFRFEIVAQCDHTTALLETHSKPKFNPTGITEERQRQVFAAFKGFLSARFVTTTEAFRAFDRDKDGYVSPGEFAAMLAANQITRKEDEAALLHAQLDDSGTGRISYSDFVAAASRESLRSLAAADGVARPTSTRQEAVRQRALRLLRTKLEARCINGFEMFRMLSSMPREPAAAPGALLGSTSTAGNKDNLLTASQLRRGAEEVLGCMFSPEEMSALMAFFFPALPVEAHGTRLEASTSHAIALPEFTQRLLEMAQLGQL